MIDKKLSDEAVKTLTKQGLRLAVAESCTGGRVASLITSIAGCTSCFQGGVVAYDNDVKIELLGVKSETLEKYKAVSKETAEEMALGVRERLKTDIGLATTGIAGPEGGTPEKPVGTVFIAVAFGDNTSVKKLSLSGDRDNIQAESARAAIRLLLDTLKSEATGE
jgi:PncC family amidohydrolase